jgi:SAM-dependent methyltransferase
METAAGSVSYDRIAAQYEQVRGGMARARQLAAAVAPWLAPASTVCDVGAGTGVVTELLCAAGMRVAAFDLSAQMLRRAGTRLPGRVAVADAVALPLADASVDAVVYLWVLHHVGDLAAALGEARRVLRPGGRAVCISGLALPLPDDIDPIFRRLNQALRPGQMDHTAAVTRAAASAGLLVLAEDTAVIEFETSPNALAAAIEQRLFAYLWDIDDATWEKVVQPEVDALRSLANPGRTRRRRASHPLRVWQAPATGRR